MDKNKIIVIVKSVITLAFLAAFGNAIYLLSQESYSNLMPALIIAGISGIIAIVISTIQHSSSQKEISEINSSLENRNVKIEELEVQIQKNNHEITENNKLTQQTETLSQILQDSDDISSAANEILETLANNIEICQGVMYVTEDNGDQKTLKGAGAYAYHKLQSDIDSPPFGVGLVGQTAQEKKPLFINELPAGYIDVVSGLGTSKPNYLALIPLIYSGNVLGVLELASFTEFTDNHKLMFDRLEQSLGAGIHFLAQAKLLDSLNKKIDNNEILQVEPEIEEIPEAATIEGKEINNSEEDIETSEEENIENND